jgi:hypothetical protein
MKPVSGTDSANPTAIQTTTPKHVGRGAQAIADALAAASGKTSEEILSLRDHGHGFGRIARDLGLDLGAVRSGRHIPPTAAPVPAAEPAPVDTLV